MMNKCFVLSPLKPIDSNTVDSRSMWFGYHPTVGPLLRAIAVLINSRSLASELDVRRRLKRLEEAIIPRRRKSLVTDGS